MGNKMSNITSEQIAPLVKLQKIDIESGKLKVFLMDVPKRLSTIDQSLEEYVRRVEDQEAIIKELNKKFRTYEADAQMTHTKIEKSQTKLHAVKTNKEYQSSLKEIEDLEVIKLKIEDEMLECLEQIENAENELKEQKKHHSQIVDQTKHEKDDINRNAEQREKKLAELEADRNAICAELDPRLLEMFDRVKATQADGVAIVEVKGAVCQGCNLNIPPQLFNELQRGDSLKNCPNCERIIYWEKYNERSE
jgi:predicted  nucleic acid-binding Zn-ribbon protein